MNMIHVIPLRRGAEKAVAEDLKTLYTCGTIQSALFIFSLVPEGTPAIDKATGLAEIFRRHRQELAGCNLPVGILIQSSIGHGWVPNEEAPFSRFRPYNGLNPYMFCPLDEQFRAHLRSQLRILGKLRADFFMLDDDVRMYTARFGGCYCPLHLAGFNQQNKTSFTAAELHEAIAGDEALARKWDAWQLSGLLQFTREIRQTMAAENPDIPGMFCACAGDIRHAVEIARTLAAPGQNPVLRINNARYMVDSPKMWPSWTQKTAYQLSAIPENFSVLAETDTFPHNRYSTSGVILHSQYAWSLLSGCRGGKLWITATMDDEPESGAYYRELLTANRGFYREVAAMKPEFSGVVEPMPQNPPFNLVNHFNGIRLDTWATAMLGFTGLPFSYEKNPPSSRTVVLSRGVEFFTDAELKKFFSGQILINGDAAIELTRRNYSRYTGVSAERWSGVKASFEQLPCGKKLFRLPEVARLTVAMPGAGILSTLCHTATRDLPGKVVAPGLVKFRNELGGTVYTAAVCFPPMGYEAYGMLNSGRKNFLTQIIDFGIYYPGDAPLHLSVFYDRNILTLSAVNLGLDLLNGIPLYGVPENIVHAQMLQPDGTWKNIPWQNQQLETVLTPHQIAFFRLLSR